MGVMKSDRTINNWGPDRNKRIQTMPAEEGTGRRNIRVG